MNKDKAVEAFTTLEAAHEKAVSALREAGSRYPEIGSVTLLLCDLGYDLGEVPLAALASRQTETDGLAAFDVAAAAGEHLNSISDPNRLFDDRGAPYRTYNGQHVVDAFKAGTALSKTRVDALEEDDCRDAIILSKSMMRAHAGKQTMEGEVYKILDAALKGADHA